MSQFRRRETIIGGAEVLSSTPPLEQHEAELAETNLDRAAW